MQISSEDHWREGQKLGMFHAGYEAVQTDLLKLKQEVFLRGASLLSTTGCQGSDVEPELFQQVGSRSSSGTAGLNCGWR